MISQNSLTRPNTLIEGQVYLLFEKNGSNEEVTYTQVTFVAYTSCPAVVIVQDRDGKNKRCVRDSLLVNWGSFSLSDE